MSCRITFVLQTVFCLWRISTPKLKPIQSIHATSVIAQQSPPSNSRFLSLYSSIAARRATNLNSPFQDVGKEGKFCNALRTQEQSLSMDDVRLEHCTRSREGRESPSSSPTGYVQEVGLVSPCSNGVEARIRTPFLGLISVRRSPTGKPRSEKGLHY